MPSWSGAGKGAIAGASTGAVLGPWGALAGGAIGGIIGGLTGSDSPAAPQITGVGYGGEYGVGGLAYGKKEANRVLTEQTRRAGLYDVAGQSALQRGQQLGGQAQLAAYQGQQGAYDQQQRANGYQGQAIGAANQYGGMSAEERAQQQGALARLQNFYQGDGGPSAAEAQMRAGADTNMAQAIALARSGRGVGANAGAMRQAQFGNAAAGQQLNQQLGVMRANEEYAWKQQQLAAMGMEQNTLAGMRGQDINAAGQAYGFAGQMGQQGLGYGQLGAQYQQIGNQAQLGFENMGNQTGLGYAQLSNQANQFGETLRNKIYNDTTNFDMNAQIANANYQAGGQGRQQQQSAADQAFVGSALTSATPALQNWGKGTGTLDDYKSDQNGYHVSDKRAKKNIQRYVSSPIEAKKDIRPVSMTDVPQDYAKQWGGVSLRDALFPPEQASAYSAPIVPGRGTDLRPAQGYAYDYKEPEMPGAAPGRHYGPMTRDLKKTPAGASVVKTDPRTGMEAVDTGRLSLVNTSAISEQQKRMDRIEQMLAQLSADPAAPETRDEVTQIPASRQAEFERWVKQRGIRDLDHPDSHYDYRGAFMAGEKAGPDAHWHDTFKQHGHPTFSNESQYAKPLGKDFGYWDDDKFVAPLPPVGQSDLDEAYARAQRDTGARFAGGR